MSTFYMCCPLPGLVLTLSSFLYSSGTHLDLHSFPTRRSSDLCPLREGLRHLRAAGVPDADEEDLLSGQRSEEHTSELQSHSDLVCRLRLEKKRVISPLQ